MAIPSPKLDDRSFAQLVEEARARIAISSPDWTDRTASDPGMVLLELFAFLTDTLLYRLNRIPEKAYIQFLNLLGVRLLPPEVASTTLVFRPTRSPLKPVVIPRGTRGSGSRTEGSTEAPVFVTSHTVTLEVGKTEIAVPACHCDLVEGELIGTGTGSGGLSVKVSQTPIIAPTQGELDLVVGVEAMQQELGDRDPARELNGKAFRIWREVDNFTLSGGDPYVYMADRVSGLITFAPALGLRNSTSTDAAALPTLANVPGANLEIRAWYGYGGGPLGNVAADTLTVLKSSLPGVVVTNPAAAVGGRSAETVANALIRGPQEVHSLQRAVTARDFELLARRSGAVSRARAFTRASLWTYAAPGTVEVVLVPHLDEDKRSGRVSRERIESLQTEEARQRIQTSLDERRPLGTTCIVSWARCKTVTVAARIVIHPDEDPIDVRARILQRLYDFVNPLPQGAHSGWRFGQALRSSQLYDAALAEPGVIYLDDISLVVEDLPEDSVGCLAVDFFQLNTWYAGSHAGIYRSMDDGDGWAQIGSFADQTVYSIQTHPQIPGLLACVTHSTEATGGSRIFVSTDCGEKWVDRTSTTSAITDLVWISRGGLPYLFIATEVGLFELSMAPSSSLDPIFVRDNDQTIGYYAVAAAFLKDGVTVAVASRNMGGIYLSDDAGKSKTFRNIGKAGEDVRVLGVQSSGGLSYLWAGLAATAVGDPGKGCFSWALLGNGQDPPEDWQTFSSQWVGGSCVQLAFQGDRVLAATYDAGVLWLERRASGEAWHSPGINCGLPQASRDHPFDRVDSLAADPRRGTLLAGGQGGVYRSKDAGAHYENASRKTFPDKVTLPPNWLFCSGEHDIQVVSGDENSSD